MVSPPGIVTLIVLPGTADVLQFKALFQLVLEDPVQVAWANVEAGIASAQHIGRAMRKRSVKRVEFFIKKAARVGCLILELGY